jgi:RNA polymerase sigma-70 factor (ECF subfamily)
MQAGIHHIHIAELQRRIAVYEDEIAYKELFLLLYNPLKRFAVTFLRSDESAEEVVSDVFVEIWSRRAKLTEIDDLRIYLYVSVRNASLRRLQQTRKNSTVSLDDVTVDFDSGYATPEEAILTSELRQKIDQAINDLPPRCKLIFKLAKEDRLRYKEISRILDINIKTIDNQLASALKKIALAVNFRLRRPNKV